MSILFNGVDQRISLAGISSLANISNWAIMGWVQVRSFASTNVLVDLSIGPNTNTRAAVQIATTGSLQVQARSTDADTLRTGTSAIGLITAGAWFHLAGVTDYLGNTIQGFINGVRVINVNPGAFSATSTPNLNSQSGGIGADAGNTSGFMAGLVEDVRIYAGRIVSADEIMNIYAAQGTDGDWSNLQNRYHLNELPVDTIATGNGSVIDFGGTINQRNGDPVNNPTYDTSVLKYRRKVLSARHSR